MFKKELNNLFFSSIGSQESEQYKTIDHGDHKSL